MAKLYKEYTTLGYPKLWAQVALGHSQSAILAAITFENEILDLATIMVPPMSSNTRSNKVDIHGNAIGGSSSSTTKADGSTAETGRPEKSETELSDKTLANRESMK